MSASHAVQTKQRYLNLLGAWVHGEDPPSDTDAAVVMAARKVFMDRSFGYLQVGGMQESRYAVVHSSYSKSNANRPL